MMRWTILALMLIGFGTAQAQTILKPAGLRVALDTARTTAAASTNAIDLSKGYSSLVIFYTGTTGTLSTQAQLSCDAGATWVNYPGVAAVTALPGVSVVTNPVGCTVRLNTATCTACTLNALAIVTE